MRAPTSCSFDTTSVSDGLYDFRATAHNDAGGSATSSVVANRRVDNTDPDGGHVRSRHAAPRHGRPRRHRHRRGLGVADVKVQRSPAGEHVDGHLHGHELSLLVLLRHHRRLRRPLRPRAVTTDNAGNATSSSIVANRRIDNTAPTATMTNPGATITGTKSFDGTASDAGSGVASLKFQVSPLGAGTWSDMCSDTTSPYACSYDTSALADGQYDFRSLATDNAGNTGTSTVYSGPIVDNTAPSATMTDPGAPPRHDRARRDGGDGRARASPT